MDSSDEEQESFWKKQPETLSQADFEKRKRKFKKNKKYRKGKHQFEVKFLFLLNFGSF